MGKKKDKTFDVNVRIVTQDEERTQFLRDCGVFDEGEVLVHLNASAVLSASRPPTEDDLSQLVDRLWKTASEHSEEGRKLKPVVLLVEGHPDTLRVDGAVRFVNNGVVAQPLADLLESMGISAWRQARSRSSHPTAGRLAGVDGTPGGL